MRKTVGTLLAAAILALYAGAFLYTLLTHPLRLLGGGSRGRYYNYQEPPAD